MSQNKRASILMITLWILALLAVFAVGLAQRTLVNLRLARFQRDRLKTDFLARAGIQRAISVLEANKKEQPAYDSLQFTWSTGLDTAGRQVLQEIELPENSKETFSVKYLYDKDKQEYLCIADEERKINLNKANDKLLKILLQEAGVEAGKQDELVKNIKLWREVPQAGTEVPPGFKKSPFSNLEEALIILDYAYKDNPEKAKEVYGQLKDLATVFGENSYVDINTCSLEVLKILAESLGTNETEVATLQNLAGQALTLREEKKFFENKDGIIIGDPANAAEQALATKLKENLLFKSAYFRINSTGKVGNITKKITAVYKCPGGSSPGNVVAWKEN